MKGVLDDPTQADVRAKIASIDVARAEGLRVAEEARRRLAAEIEAVRRPYRDDPWPWIMVRHSLARDPACVRFAEMSDTVSADRFAALVALTMTDGASPGRRNWIWRMRCGCLGGRCATPPSSERGKHRTDDARVRRLYTPRR
jgi:hypothetical protein